MKTRKCEGGVVVEADPIACRSLSCRGWSKRRAIYKFELLPASLSSRNADTPYLCMYYLLTAWYSQYGLQSIVQQSAKSDMKTPTTEIYQSKSRRQVRLVLALRRIHVTRTCALTDRPRTRIRRALIPSWLKLHHDGRANVQPASYLHEKT